MSRKLTSKQEGFCVAMASGLKQVDAYRKSYDCGTMAQNTIHTKAYELIQNGAVADRIKELRAPAIESAQITLESHLAELGRLATVAEDKGNIQAAIKAQELRGKASGLYVEKIDQNVSGGVTVEIIRFG